MIYFYFFKVEKFQKKLKKNIFFQLEKTRRDTTLVDRFVRLTTSVFLFTQFFIHYFKTIIMRIKNLLLANFLIGFSFLSIAQSPVSAFMDKKNKGAVVVNYTVEKYDKVLLHPNNAEAVPVFNNVTVTSKSLYATYGISDKFNVVVSSPYIIAKGNATEGTLKALNYQNERRGFQDFSLFLKYNPYSTKIGENTLDFIVSAGIKTPKGRYKVNEGLQSILAIGNRATSVTGIAIAQFRTKTGLFVGTQAGYSVRNGDVPDAVIGEIKAGYATGRFYVDAWYAGQISQGGVNILGEGFAGFFPATDVSYNRAGLNIFVPIGKGFGVSGAVSQYLSGRNVGKSTGFSGALIYSF